MRYRNSVLNAHTLPGADADTDHNLLTAEVCLALIKLPKKGTVKTWNKKSCKQKQDSKMKAISIPDEPEKC